MMARNIMLQNIVDSVDSQIIRYGYTGKFYCEFMPFTYQWQVAFKIEHKYLSVLDIMVFDRHDIHHFDNSLQLVRRFFDIVKEIDYQFRFYFEGIWG